MIWPFRRKPKPPQSIIDRRDNSEDWRPNDVAQCIDARWSHPHFGAPQVGQTFRVTGVADAIGSLGARAYFLYFRGKVSGYESRCFRKLRPAEEEFTTLVSKRKRAPETVS